MLPHNPLVILVHGINTWAHWMGGVKSTLEKAGFAVAPTSYDRYGIPRFLAPFPRLRRKAIERVVTNIRTAIRRHKRDTGSDPKRMSVISHSFGTYVISHILTEPEFHWYRVIFCGSVVRNDFPFDKAEKQFDALLNEVGTKDFLPALAASAGWDYGSVGSNGLNHPLVETRWHHGLKHSDFLTESFCRKFWVPFLLGNKPIPAGKAIRMPFWIRAITAFPLRWIILLLVTVLILLIPALGVALVRPTWLTSVTTHPPCGCMTRV
jgi:hypothetical protein